MSINMLCSFLELKDWLLELEFLSKISAYKISQLTKSQLTNGNQHWISRLSEGGYVPSYSEAVGDYVNVFDCANPAGKLPSMINLNTAASCQTSASSYYNQTEQYVSVRSANKVLIEFEERSAESGKDWKLWKFQFLSLCPYSPYKKQCWVLACIRVRH